MAIWSATEPVYVEENGARVPLTVSTLAAAVIEQAGGIEALPVGASILSGEGIPSDAIGKDGDLWLDTRDVVLYGPRTDGRWPTEGLSLVGPPGSPGGRTILSGDGAPGRELGEDGDFYLDTRDTVLWGPKADGEWPVEGVSLVGPRGEQGEQGPQGPQGPQGDPGVGLPAGGSAGYLAAKASGADYDVQWVAPPVAGGDGSTAALRRLGSSSGEASPGVSALHVVEAGDDPDATRPAGAAVVLWVVDEGVEPRERAAGDLVVVIEEA